MGSRRLGCPLPTPPDSRALRLGTLTNLFVGDLSFFFFCCIKNSTCEDSPCIRTNEKIGIVEDKNLSQENFGSFLLNCGVKMNQCYPKCGLGIFGGVLYRHGTLTDRHAARTDRMRKKRVGMVHGEKRRRWKECPGVKETERKRGRKRGEEQVFQIPLGSRLKLGEGVKLNIILTESPVNFSHLSKGGSPSLEKKEE